MSLPNLSIIGKIHEGRFSIVYKAKQGEKLFVLKQLHPNLDLTPAIINNFESEAKFYNQLYGGGCEYVKSSAEYFIIREYFEGATLKEIHVKYKGRKFYHQYLNVYRSLIQQLIYLHENGFVHGDIKPSNILVESFVNQPQVKLLDLGLAFNIHSKPVKDVHHKLPFSMVYAAPELMLNEPELISANTDLFSVGICMYESFSGETAYDANHPAILLQMMLALPLKHRKKIPTNLHQFINQLTFKPNFTKPVSHYSAMEVKQILTEYLEIRNRTCDAGAAIRCIESLIV